ncbi:MFS-type transporter SLC18B1-like isoform X1 [Macrosteles quadrilineatus]|uniref:MFS-type transporter SLC18B1-like isoform X1 n=1 Tax=Macrosteles quadrilineatus TaxID=74068 RepID=UPI0023E1B9EF|nr:MFS-type transporter SLC18B1-like isoform X1 [Macrosteles quadrilineatus]
MPPSGDTPIISDVEDGARNNNTSNRGDDLLVIAIVDSKSTDRLTHFCRPGERSIRSPTDLAGPPQRQLFCKTHSVKTKCVLKPASENHVCQTPDEEDEHIPAKPKPLKLSEFSKQQVLVLLTLALGNFLSFCSMSILAPFFPKEANLKGMDVSLSGLVFSFYALIVSLTAPFLGKMLPKIGAKPLYIWGLMLAAASNILFGLLPHIMDYTLFTVMAFLVRGMEALGASAFSTSSFVFIVETFPDNISTILGVMETVIGLGMSVGPAIGGILYSIGGFGLPFFILGGIMFIVVPLDIWVLPPASAETKNNPSGSFWKLVKIPAVFVVSIIIVISSNVWSFLDPVLEPHLETFSLTSRQVGFVFLLFSSVYAVFSLFWGWLADKLNNHWSMMVVGLAISTGSLLVLGPSPHLTSKPNALWVDLVALCVLGISVALTLMPTYQAILNFAVERGLKRHVTTYSLVAGTWSCMYSLGEMIGPTVGGFALQNYGFPILTTGMAYSTFIMMVISLVYFSCRHFCPAEVESEKSTQKKPLLENPTMYYGACTDQCVLTLAPVSQNSMAFSV